MTTLQQDKMMFTGNALQQLLESGTLFVFVPANANLNDLAEKFTQIGITAVFCALNEDNTANLNGFKPLQQNPLEYTKGLFTAALMADFNRIVAAKDVKAAENWLEVNGFKGWWDHRVNENTPQAEIERTIFEQFHHAYDRWTQDHIKALLRKRSDIIFPNTPNGRRMAMYKDEA